MGCVGKQKECGMAKSEVTRWPKGKRDDKEESQKPPPEVEVFRYAN